jgi:hypothetical protein
MTTKQEAAEAVRASKARLGVTWEQLADPTDQADSPPSSQPALRLIYST